MANTLVLFQIGYNWQHILLYTMSTPTYFINAKGRKLELRKKQQELFN